MTAFRFLCSHCQSKLSADIQLAARPCGCPRCGTTIIPESCTPRDIRFRCPECRTSLLVDQQAAGNEVSCPQCRVRVTIPGQQTHADALPDPASARLSEEEIKFLTA